MTQWAYRNCQQARGSALRGDIGSGQGAGLGSGRTQFYPVVWLREHHECKLSADCSAVEDIPPSASADVTCRMIERKRVGNC
jgi:hypothetical protein